MAATAAAFTEVTGLHDVAVHDRVLTCTADAEAMEPLLRRLTSTGIHALTCSPPSLEELFLEVYRGDQAQPLGSPA